MFSMAEALLICFLSLMVASVINNGINNYTALKAVKHQLKARQKQDKEKKN